MQEPDYVDIEVFVGVDIAKGDHYACVVTSAGAEVLARSVRNDEAAIGRLIDDAAVHGTVALVIDTTSSAASLLLEAAARREVPVAYVTGPGDAACCGPLRRGGQDRPQRRRGARRLRPAQRRPPELDDTQRRAAGAAADPQRPRRRPRRGRHQGRQPAQRRAVDGVALRWSAPWATSWPPVVAHATRWPAGAPRTALRDAGKARVRTRIAKRSPRTAQPAHRRHLGRRWTRRASPSQPRQPGRHHHRARRRPRPHLRSPRPARQNSSKTRSWATRWEKSSPACAGSAREPAPGPSLRSATPTASPTAAALAAYAGLAPVDWQSGRSATVRKPRGGNHRLKLSSLRVNVGSGVVDGPR